MPGPITGGFPAGVGAPPVTISGVPTAGQVPTAVTGTTATWQAGGGGGGGTFPATTNLIKGTGVANAGADSGINPDQVSIQPTSVASGDVLASSGDNNIVSAGVTATDFLSGNIAALAVKNATGLILSNGSNSITGVTDLPDGTTATTQAENDNSTKVSTTAYTDTAVGRALFPNGDISDTSGTNAEIRAYADAVLAEDTGWTANADAGDKTAVIPASATLTAMQAALNLVVAGFGDAFVASAQKTKALETALANALRPNA